MTKLFLVLLACTACASAPATTVPAPGPSVSGPMLTGAAKWADSAGRLIDKATFAGNLQGLRNAGLLLDQALAAYPNDALLLQYRGYELYREAGLLGTNPLTAKAELPLVGQVAATGRIKLLESLAAQPLAETHALLAMTMGRMIGLDQIYSPTLGPLIPKEMNAAIAMGPNNPRVWLLRGIQSFYTKPEYGAATRWQRRSSTKQSSCSRQTTPRHPLPRGARLKRTCGWARFSRNKTGSPRHARRITTHSRYSTITRG